MKPITEVLKMVLSACGPGPHFSSPRSRFFTIWTDPRPENNILYFTEVSCY